LNAEVPGTTFARLRSKPIAIIEGELFSTEAEANTGTGATQLFITERAE
jgi:hypothetical protein